MSPPATLRKFRPGDEEGICDLYARTFGIVRSVEYWRWLYERLPSSMNAIFVADAEGKIVGHAGAFVVDAYIHGNRASFACGADMMVADPTQAIEQGPALGRALTDHLKQMGWGMMGIGRWYPDRVVSLVGAARFGQLPRFVRPLSVHGIEVGLQRELPAVGRGFARAAIGLWTAASRVIRPRVNVVPLADPGEEVDRLAAESASFASLIRIRDAAYLRWRWLDQPEASWNLIGARLPGGRLVGYAVFGIDKNMQEKVKIGRVVDLLAVDARTTRALLDTACRGLAADGCGLAILHYTDPRPWARRACYFSGFVRIDRASKRGEGRLAPGQPLYVYLRPPSGSELASTGIRDLYLTLGDSHLV